MKVSLNWIKEYLDFDLPPVDELVEKIGIQLGAVEEVVNLGDKYTGIVIVKVVKCQKLEGTDHLSICKIDDGGKTKDVERDDKGHVQVVCGAPNVSEGMIVAWLPPGSTVPSSFGTADPFVLEAREIRGQKSNGMLASPKELALGDSQEGLLIIDYECKPGADFADIYKINDYIIDIENKMFTHRPDCFGQLGVAREIAGILEHTFNSPDWYKTIATNLTPRGTNLPLTVKNELPRLVPRFMALTFSGVEIKPSTVWYQTFLNRVGIRPINSIVDITNYMMLLTGQPLHVYDYDKVKALSSGEATIVIRNPKPGEKVKLLNGKEIEPRAEAIMIATDKQLIGVGGVMGGADTEVDESTKNIILECANFDMYSIRRTAMAHGLFTDAVTRFTKGQSPLQNERIMMQAAKMICDTEAAEFASDLIDDNHLDSSAMERQSLHMPITVSTNFINERLGLKLSVEEMKKLLENVEFAVDARGDELTITAPFWRTDIELREDVVEEIGRLYGYDKLPLELPKRDLTPAPKDPLLELKATIRDKLSRAGANEVLTYSFVHGNLLDKVGQSRDQAFQIANALSPDLQYYRISLAPSLLEKVHPNIKAGYDQFALFELGKTHSLDHYDDDDGLPREFEFTSLVVAADNKLKKAGSAYYQARKYLTALAGSRLTFKPVSPEMQKYPVVQPYDTNRCALVSVQSSGEFLGIIGEFKPSVTAKLKLPTYCAGFEIDTEVLLKVLDKANNYVALPRFPKVTQDITLKVPADLAYQELFDLIQVELDKIRPTNTGATLTPIDVFQRQEDAKHKHITFRLSIASYDRTLTDIEVNKLLDTAAAAAKIKYNAERV